MHLVPTTLSTYRPKIRLRRLISLTGALASLLRPRSSSTAPSPTPLRRSPPHHRHLHCVLSPQLPIPLRPCVLAFSVRHHCFCLASNCFPLHSGRHRGHYSHAHHCRLRFANHRPSLFNRPYELNTSFLLTTTISCSWLAHTGDSSIETYCLPATFCNSLTS